MLSLPLDTAKLTPGLAKLVQRCVALFPAIIAVTASEAETVASHAPRQPKSGEPIVITINTPPAAKVADFAVEYQVVDPGSYIALADPSYAEGWKRLAVSRSEAAATKQIANLFSASIPAVVQRHRRLIRYRVRSLIDEAVVVPAADDPQRNLAYFVYDGIPAWQAAINPQGSEAERKVRTFSPEVMRSVPAYHLISTRPAVENVTWLKPKHYSDPSASKYQYTGTLVVDGKVYDHVRFRARGGNWRHAMGKNMWKIDFLKGHNLAARDNWGRRYETKWGKLNLGACIQQGDYGMRGEQGMFEAVAYRLFNLAGVEASHTHWVQLRIIDGVEESPANQYRGDFWGLYLAVENLEDDFLKEHALPDGNLYKMDGEPEPAHVADGAPTDGSDVRRFMSELRGKPDEKWWRSNVDLPRYYSYRSVLECIHHYDIGAGKNYYYFHHPVAKRWQVVPWDVDLTWSDAMYGNGAEPFQRAGVLESEPLKAEYQARLAEIRDLLFNPEQTGALIEEYAAMISDPKGGSSMVDADRAKWDHHPVMSSQYVVQSKTRPGLFYKGAPTQDFRGMLQLMKSYVNQRGKWVDQTLLANASFPGAPTIGTPETLKFSAPHLPLRLTAPAAGAKVSWRLAEVTDPRNSAGQVKQPWRYEIESLWEATGGEVAEVPTKSLVSGHTYRVRARNQDPKGLWSRWSAPVQFTTPGTTEESSGPKNVPAKVGKP